MKKSGGRENEESPVHQGTPHGKLHSELSSSIPDSVDEKILTLAADRPVTLLNMSRKVDIPFVECLRRARKLQRMNLLEKTETPHKSNGMSLYVATLGKGVPRFEQTPETWMRR